MKKLMILCAGLILASVIAANAQSSDTTRNPTRQSGEIAQPVSQEPSNQMKKDLVVLKTSELPASLRKTLEDPMYIGWEKSTIWTSKSTGEYTLELMSGGSTMNRTYHFDKSGKPIKDF